MLSLSQTFFSNQNINQGSTQSKNSIMIFWWEKIVVLIFWGLFNVKVKNICLTGKKKSAVFLLFKFFKWVSSRSLIKTTDLEVDLVGVPRDGLQALVSVIRRQMQSSSTIRVRQVRIGFVYKTQFFSLSFIEHLRVLNQKKKRRDDFFLMDFSHRITWINKLLYFNSDRRTRQRIISQWFQLIGIKITTSFWSRLSSRY